MPIHGAGAPDQRNVGLPRTQSESRRVNLTVGRHSTQWRLGSPRSVTDMPLFVHNRTASHLRPVVLPFRRRAYRLLHVGRSTNYRALSRSVRRLSKHYGVGEDLARWAEQMSATRVFRPVDVSGT